MIYKATRLIARAMDAEEIKYSVHEQENYSEISAMFGVKNGPDAVVRFLSSDDDNDVRIVLFGLVRDVAEEKHAEMLKAINECNNKFRYIKFILDSDNDVNLEYDLPLRTDDCCVGEVACEAFLRIMKVVEDCYPVFMKVIWS